jgi:hypothetical protein
VRHIAIIHFGEDEMAVGLGDTEEEAANNAVEAYGGPEHLRHNIDIYDLVDGMRLLYDQNSVSRVYRGALGAGSAPGVNRPLT